MVGEPSCLERERTHVPDIATTPTSYKPQTPSVVYQAVTLVRTALRQFPEPG